MENKIENFKKSHEHPLELRKVELERKAAELNKLLTTISMPKKHTELQVKSKE